MFKKNQKKNSKKYLGVLLNTFFIYLLSVSVSSADLQKNIINKLTATKTLTFTNDPTTYAQEDGRCKILNFTGTPGATCTVTFPNKLMWYVILNNTGDSNDIVCTAGTGAATYTVSAGRDAIIYVDGSDEIYNAINDLP